VSSAASMRTSRAATAGRRSRVFAICLGEYPQARNSRIRSGTCVSAATPVAYPADVPGGAPNTRSVADRHRSVGEPSSGVLGVRCWWPGAEGITAPVPGAASLCLRCRAALRRRGWPGAGHVRPDRRPTRIDAGAGRWLPRGVCAGRPQDKARCRQYFSAARSSHRPRARGAGFAGRSMARAGRSTWSRTTAATWASSANRWSTGCAGTCTLHSSIYPAGPTPRAAPLLRHRRGARLAQMTSGYVDYVTIVRRDDVRRSRPASRPGRLRRGDPGEPPPRCIGRCRAVLNRRLPRAGEAA
jgi:hypothetical protein